MKVFGWVYVALVCIGVAWALSTAVYAEEVPTWKGFYLQGQAGSSVGSHDLFYGNDFFDFAIDIYSIPLQGDIQAFGVGYLFPLGKSGFYIGPKTMARFGEVSGSQSWSILHNALGARVDVSSQTIYTLGVQVGYAFNSNWLLTVDGGIAAADTTLCGQAHILWVKEQECVEGFAIGPYAGLGVQRSLGHGWALGGEMEFFHFEGAEDFGYNGVLQATINQTSISVTLTKRF